MIVKCVRKGKYEYDPEPITVGKEYIVLEIILSKKEYKKDLSMSYRIINNTGSPVIYDAPCFTVVSNELKGMVFDYHENWCIITPQKIFYSTIGSNNVNGFWAYLFETDDLEALKLVESVVREINSDQITDLPEITIR